MWHKAAQKVRLNSSGITESNCSLLPASLLQKFLHVDNIQSVKVCKNENTLVVCRRILR